MKTQLSDPRTKQESIVDVNFKIRRWYNQRDVKFIAAVIIFVVLFQSYGLVTGPSRVSADLQQAMDSGEKKLNILVWANFSAEAFHMELYFRVEANSL